MIGSVQRDPATEAFDPGELTFVAEQLWPSSAGPDYKVVDGVQPLEGWAEVERHWTFGRRGRINLLLPDSRSSAARALLSYAGLRPIRRRLARLVLAQGILAGVVRPHRSIALHARRESEQDTVLQQIAASLGEPLGALMHVRRTANRKALLQLVNSDGGTVGYAKIARDELTSAGVRNEITVLEELDGGTGRVKTPRIILKGEVGGFPYLVTEPLPRDIRAVTASLQETPLVTEIASIALVSRWSRPAETGHIQRLRMRAQTLLGTSQAGHVSVLEELLFAVEAVEVELPVATRFHGDFAFWNVGRTPDGTLWCWDFESTEPDALAGLDNLHWHASRRRHHSGAEGLLDRSGILEDAAGALRAFGAGSRDAHLTIYRTYIAEIVMRTLEAAATDGWSRVWCRPHELRGIVNSALRS